MKLHPVVLAQHWEHVLDSFQVSLTIHSQLLFAITRQLINKDIKSNHEATEN